MARMLTKELADKIVKKLGAKCSPSQRPGSPHEYYDFEYKGVLVARLSLRRGSNWEKGHDHMIEELFLGPNKAKQLGQCSISLEKYIILLQEAGHIAPDDGNS